MRTVRTLLVAIFLAAPALPASGQGLTDLIMSPADEERIGAQQHEKILAEFGGAYDDPELARYVDSIGQFLAKTSSAAGSGFTFTVLNTPVVNAFALPGGYVYVTRGLLALADDEAELAGVIAHEIGHVAARHGAKRQTKGTLANLGLMILGAATDSSAAVGLGQLGASAVISNYSREDEYEADSLGVQYLSRAGFDPEAMASFLAKLNAHDELQKKLLGGRASDGFDFFASHPRTADRVRQAIKRARSAKVADPIVAEDIYFEKIDGMLYGDDPSQGVIQGQRFVHPELRLEFTVPDGFQLVNGPTAVIARGPNGAGLKYDVGQPATGANMVAYIRDSWARQANVARLQHIDVNGRRAATGVIAGIQNGQADARLVAIYYRKRVHRFAFVIPHQYGNRLDSAIQRTIYSFRPVRGNQLRAFKGQQLAIHEVQEGESARKLARRMPFDDHRLRRFRVLNGLSANDELRVGQKVKLVLD